LCCQRVHGAYGLIGDHVSRMFKPDQEHVHVQHSWDVMMLVSMLGRVFGHMVQVYLLLSTGKTNLVQ